jgi:hypothetical protein
VFFIINVPSLGVNVQHGFPGLDSVASVAQVVGVFYFSFYEF